MSNLEQEARERELVNKIVSRFLGWKLPNDFSPDAGISFKREFNENTDHPMRHEPIGTNLFTATQAEEMINYILGDSLTTLLTEAVEEMEQSKRNEHINPDTGFPYYSDYWKGKTAGINEALSIAQAIIKKKLNQE